MERRTQGHAPAVGDDDVVTARAATACIDLALHLPRCELGADLAIRGENLIDFERRNTVWQR